MAVKTCRCGAEIPDWRFACVKCAALVHELDAAYKARDAAMLDLEFMLAARGIFVDPDDDLPPAA
jgi:hypothetical protein